MVHVHLPDRFYDYILHRPVLVLCIAMIVFGGWAVFCLNGYREYRGFGHVPEIVNLQTVGVPEPNHGKWVRIDQPLETPCYLGMQQVNDPPESWLLGRVENTLFLAKVPGSNRNLIIEYHGDLDCKALALRPMIGILEELTSRQRSVVNGKLSIPPSAVAMHLSLGAGPQSYRRAFFESLFAPLVVSLLVWFAWSKRKQKSKQKSLENPFSRPDEI